MIQNLNNWIILYKDELQILIAFIVVIIGLATLIKGIHEYKLQGKQKRVDLYNKIKEKLRSDKRLSVITDLVENDSLELKKIPKFNKYYFLGYYEEILIALNSGLIKKDVVHYMIGYYALRCWESKNFWYIDDKTIIDKNAYYWKLFAEFVSIMQKIEKRRVNPNFIQKLVDKIKFKRIYRY